ncbi:lycopene cyclase domain-containing protein [Patescibacteria group bacterium]|nr:lycopene cyclase domain-containing protein [Patescibacteria group bacterium]
MSYTIWLSFFVFVPIIILWIWRFRLLWHYRRTLAYAMFFALVVSIPWDYFAIKNHIWYFPKEGNLGILVYGLPFEEFIFMASVTLLLGSIVIIMKYRTRRG